MLHLPAEEGDIDPAQNEMIRRMFSFTESTVDQLMVPLIDVVGVERSASRAEASRIAAEGRHVLLPVYEERVDRIVGLLDTLKLLGKAPEEPITGHVREARFVPESKSAKDLLLELRGAGERAAIVVDEFGGAAGLVTLEDIMEEVVTEIEDEYDTAAGKAGPNAIRKIDDRSYLVSGRTEIGELEARLGIELPEGAYTTLAGFLLSRLGDVPSAGSVLEVDGVTYTVKRASPQTIEEVQVRV